MQVVVKASFHQSFGRIHFMDAGFRKWGLAGVFTEHLGQRSANACYSYAEVAKSLCFMFSIGGEVLNDLNTLREQLQDHPCLPICSPDKVEYVCGELRQPTQMITTAKGIRHSVNVHEGFNKLLPRLCVQGGVLATKQTYTLDCDGHIVENTNADNAFAYKHTRGYFPVC